MEHLYVLHAILQDKLQLFVDGVARFKDDASANAAVELRRIRRRANESDDEWALFLLECRPHFYEFTNAVQQELTAVSQRISRWDERDYMRATMIADGDALLCRLFRVQIRSDEIEADRDVIRQLLDDCVQYVVRANECEPV
jgi:hypothetical protein